MQPYATNGGYEQPMSKTAKSQQYQEIEAESHTETQESNVITLPLQSQESAREVQGDAREVQPQPRPNFPANMTELGEAFGVSRQAITPKFKAIADIYREFGRSREVENGGLCLEQGYEELVNYYKNSKPSLPRFKSELRDRLQASRKTATSQQTEATAMVPASPQSYAIKPMATSPLARYDAKIARAGELSEQVQEMGQVYSANNRIIAEQYLRSRVADAKQLRAIGDQLFLAELLGGQNELAEILAKEEEKQ